MELVRLTTQDVGRGIPITDTIIVSEKYQVKHDSVLRILRKYKDEFEIFGKLNGFEIHRDTQRNSTGYFLNENQFFLLVTYMKNTEIARKYKIEFVKAFSKIKTELQVRKETRNFAIKVRNSLTDTIKISCTDEGNFKKFAYSNYSKLIYKKALGKEVKKLKEDRGLKKDDNIRDFLTVEEIEKVQETESKVAMLIESWKLLDLTDKEIYDKIKEKI